MPETPYPGPAEVTVTYTLREVLDQMNSKLDLIPQLVSDAATHKADLSDLETRHTALEVRVEAVERVQSDQSAVSLFKDKIWAKIALSSTIIGVVAGTIIAALRVIFSI